MRLFERFYFTCHVINFTQAEYINCQKLPLNMYQALGLYIFITGFRSRGGAYISEGTYIRKRESSSTIFAMKQAMFALIFTFFKGQKIMTNQKFISIHLEGLFSDVFF